MLTIVEKNKCTGCEVCVNICPEKCIQVVADNEGFLYPEIDNKKCINCGNCQKKCPANSEPLYNNAKDVFAAWSLDESIRRSSSSGGMFSIFANHVVASGGVANGVKFNKELGLEHKLLFSLEDVRSCRGSKYVQSAPGDIYSQVKKFLDSGKSVFFTSTPCQVDGLYKYLGGHNYDNLITCDLICHGVPSPEYLRKIVKEMTPPDTTAEKISFRDLTQWGGFEIVINDIVRKTEISNLYIIPFLKGYNYRKSCYCCRYAKTSRVADLTLGDFWGLGKYRKFSHDTSWGTSLVMVNTEKGKMLFDAVKKDIFYEKRALSEAVRDNTQLSAPVKKTKYRDDFYKNILSMSIDEIKNCYCNKKRNFCVRLAVFFFWRVPQKIMTLIFQQFAIKDRI